MTEQKTPNPGEGPRQWKPAVALLCIWILWAALLAACLGLGAAGIAFQFGGPAIGVFSLVAAGVWLTGSAIGTLHFRSLVYSLDDCYVTKVTGCLWRHRRAVPLEQITSLDVRQGPLERLLAMGQVWIFTPSAADMSPEEKLVGVRNPDEVREHILRRAQQAKQHPGIGNGAGALQAADLRELLETIRDSLDAIRGRLPAPEKESTNAPREAPESD